MVYVLMFVIATAGTSGGISVTTAEFANQSACQAAGTQAKDLNSWVTTTRFVCVPKGKPE